MEWNRIAGFGQFDQVQQSERTAYSKGTTQHFRLVIVMWALTGEEIGVGKQTDAHRFPGTGRTFRALHHLVVQLEIRFNDG